MKIRKSTIGAINPILKMTGGIELVVSRQYSAAVKEKLEVYNGK